MQHGDKKTQWNIPYEGSSTRCGFRRPSLPKLFRMVFTNAVGCKETVHIQTFAKTAQRQNRIQDAFPVVTGHRRPGFSHVIHSCSLIGHRFLKQSQTLLENNCIIFHSIYQRCCGARPKGTISVGRHHPTKFGPRLQTYAASCRWGFMVSPSLVVIFFAYMPSTLDDVCFTTIFKIFLELSPIKSTLDGK